MSALLAVLAMFFVFPKVVGAQIVINEFSAKTDPEWVEVYNTSTQSANLEGWEIADGNSISSDDLTLSGIIDPKSFLVFERPKGWLNDGGDTIKLFDNSTPSGQLIDSFMYTSARQDKTISRIPDGSGDFMSNTDPTKGGPNQAPPTPTEEDTPTPTPTSTLTPTSAPTSTSTPTPTSTLTPTTVTPTSSPRVLSSSTNSAIYNLFFQESTVSGLTGTQSASVETKLKIKPILVGLGLLFLSSSILVFRNKNKLGVK